jgi:hypothetical protein
VKDLIAAIAIYIIHFGMIGMIGALVRRSQCGFTLLQGTGILACFVFSLGLPFAIGLRWVTFLLSLIIFSLSMLQPKYLPRWLWSARLGWGYLLLIMVLIILWGLLNSPNPVGLLMTVLALLAGIMVWQHGFCNALGDLK